jgi:hypothetical protein
VEVLVVVRVRVPETGHNLLLLVPAQSKSRMGRQL